MVHENASHSISVYMKMDEVFVNSKGKLSPWERVRQERIVFNVPLSPVSLLLSFSLKGPIPQSSGSGLLCYHVQSYVEFLVI